MIGRRPSRDRAEDAQSKPRSFDDFDLRLGDVMRGERATLGKSLLDVQRELRIKAGYIAAIENCDPSAFDTPGFIAGYVRSYARYLGMDPDRAFAAFCAESGFSPAHGMAEEASTIRKPRQQPRAETHKKVRDPFADPSTPFAPKGDSLLSRIEPGAIGSLLVLVGLVGAIGFGGVTVLREIQRVQLAPVDQTPVVLSDLDPLEGVEPAESETGESRQAAAPEALGGVYRPQPLDLPVLVSRDAPISTLDPDTIGAFARADRPALPPSPAEQEVAEAAEAASAPSDDTKRSAQMPQVVEETGPEVVLFAIRPAWVRVRAGDGSILFEKILDAGEQYVLPQTEEPPVLRAGMSGSIYFEVNGELYGPAGQGTGTIRNVALSVEALKDRYQLADLDEDPELAKVIALAEAQDDARVSE
ncbi:MAG: helix-turn-helix domain-containing protein [Paracoccaceae bacterium]